MNIKETALGMQELSASSLDLFKWCGKQGLFQTGLSSDFIFLPEKFKSDVYTFELLGKELLDLNKGFVVLAHLLSVIYPLSLFANQNVRNEHLKSCIDGLTIGAHAMTEADSGSDISALKTTISKNKIEGGKSFITNSSLASIMMVYGQHSPAISGIPSNNISCLLLLNNEINPMEIESNISEGSWGNVFFSNPLEVTERLVGGLGKGFKVFSTTMLFERIGLAFFHLGLTKGILKELEQTFKKTDLINSPHYQEAITTTLIVEAVCIRAINSLGTTKEEIVQSSLAKVYSSDGLMKVSSLAMKLFTAHGKVNHRVAKLSNSSLLSTMYSGSKNLLQRNISALSYDSI